MALQGRRIPGMLEKTMITLGLVLTREGKRLGGVVSSVEVSSFYREGDCCQKWVHRYNVMDIWVCIRLKDYMCYIVWMCNIEVKTVFLGLVC